MLCFHICLQTRHGKNRYKLRQFCNSETEYRKAFGEFCLKIQKYCLKTSQPAIASLRCCCRLCRQGGEEVGLASQPLLSAVTLPSATTLSTPCRASHQYQVHSGPGLEQEPGQAAVTSQFRHPVRTDADITRIFTFSCFPTVHFCVSSFLLYKIVDICSTKKRKRKYVQNPENRLAELPIP